MQEKAETRLTRGGRVNCTRNKRKRGRGCEVLVGLRFEGEPSAVVQEVGELVAERIKPVEQFDQVKAAFQFFDLGNVRLRLPKTTCQFGLGDLPCLPFLS